MFLLAIGVLSFEALTGRCTKLVNNFDAPLEIYKESQLGKSFQSFILLLFVSFFFQIIKFPTPLKFFENFGLKKMNKL